MLVSTLGSIAFMPETVSNSYVSISHVVCFASNSLQLIFSFSAINVASLSSVACALQLTFPAHLQLFCNQCRIIVFSGMCLAVDIPSKRGADFEVLVPHIPIVSLVINAHAVARLIVDTLFVDCSGI